MSESNIELVRRGYEAFLHGDLETLEAFLDPALKWHAGDPTAAGACVNRDQALRFMRAGQRRREAEGVAKPELAELADAGDRVVVLLRHPDAPAEERMTANVTTLREGRAVEMVHYPDPHRALMAAALHQDAVGQRALLDGDADEARGAFTRAAALYRRSWEHASPTSYGRLVGLIKAAILSGEGERDAAGYVLEAVNDRDPSSPTAAYAAALAALTRGEDAQAGSCTAAMRNAASEPFQRAGAAIEALAAGDGAAYGRALSEIVADFEARADHLTGVPIADTALVLERLAEPRGLAARIESPLLPAIRR